MASVYLETCALVLRAEAAVANPTPRATHGASLVNGLLSAPTGSVAISPVGLAEFRSVVATKLQDNSSAVVAAFDDVWFTTVVGQLMKELADGKIIVCDQPPKAIEHAIVLVDLAARQHGRKFRVWDAVHLVTATAWAASVGDQIEFWTCDDDYSSFVALYPHFGKPVLVKSLNP